MTYTPGPWVVIQPEANEIGQEMAVKHECYFVATVHDMGGPSGDTEREANARLIAAAPELLAELKSMKERFHMCCLTSGSDREYADLAVAKAFALISKAEGRP